MGNSGLRKIFFQGDYVETTFASLYDITVVDINKNEEPLNKLQGHYSLAVNSCSASDADLKQLQELRTLVEQTDIHLLLFPCNTFRNETKTYSDIIKSYGEVLAQRDRVSILQKVEVNGRYTHPVYKYLKRNTPQLYDKDLCRGRLIREDFCKFLIDKDGLPIKYYSKNVTINEIQNDINKLKNV